MRTRLAFSCAIFSQVFPWYASVVPYKASFGPSLDPPRPSEGPQGTLRDPQGSTLARATIFVSDDVRRVIKMHDVLHKYIVLLLFTAYIIAPAWSNGYLSGLSHGRPGFDSRMELFPSTF